MYSKQDYLTALKKLGFQQESLSTTSGSHIRYVHKKYSNIYAGIDDHKNTKEMKPNVHNDLMRAFLLVVWLETRNEAGKVNFTKAKQMLKGIDKMMVAEILDRLKKLDLNSDSYLLAIIPKRLATEVGKIKKDLTNQTILDYILN